MKRVITIFLAVVIGSAANFSCISIDTIVPKSGGKLDTETIVAGLKEALEIGIQNAVKSAGKKNGYLLNAQIKVLMPEELKDFARKLSDIGLKDKVDEFIESMNRAAEEAAPKAADIFIKAIKKMTLKDAEKILKGPDNAATAYFEEQTRKNLYGVFRPVVKSAMDSVGVTKIFKLLVDAYNKIPLVNRVSFDLDDYVTNKALDGLFYLLAGEEKKIRTNPAARVTELLRKVFG